MSVSLTVQSNPACCAASDAEVALTATPALTHADLFVVIVIVPPC